MKTDWQLGLFIFVMIVVMVILVMLLVASAIEISQGFIDKVVR